MDQEFQYTPVRVHGKSYIYLMTTYERLLGVEYHEKITLHIMFYRYAMLGSDIGTR